MDAANSVATRETSRYALAGLHAGVVGTIVMVVCLMAESTLHRRSIWQVPNLFATTFFGPEAYREGFHSSSASGIALMLAIYGVGGLLWGLAAGYLWKDERKPF